MTRLLALIRTGRAGPPTACARVRTGMANQLTRHRLAAAAPPGVAVAAKSGGLLGIVRNEIGVLTYPDNTAYAVAVFTRTRRTTLDGRTIDSTIGQAAHHAVHHLRDRPEG